MMLVHKMQSALDKCHESKFVSLDFSAAFDTINNNKLQSAGVGGKVSSILTECLIGRQQRVNVDNSFSSFSVCLLGFLKVVFLAFCSSFNIQAICGPALLIKCYAEDISL